MERSAPSGINGADEDGNSSSGAAFRDTSGCDPDDGCCSSRCRRAPPTRINDSIHAEVAPDALVISSANLSQYDRQLVDVYGRSSSSSQQQVVVSSRSDCGGDEQVMSSG